MQHHGGIAKKYRYRGKTDLCQSWMGIMGCADIGHTAWYEAHVQ